MERLEKLLRERHPLLELRVNEPMSRHTTFRIGGPAALMALPKNEEEVQLVLSVAALEFGVKPFFMGRGTNLLVSDAGAGLLVVKAYDGLNRLELLPQGEWPGQQTILAGSGVSLARLAGFALEHGLTGLEFAHGIPGSLGGAVFMNAGAYGGEMKQVLSSVTAWLPGAGIRQLSLEELDLGYRHSVFSGTRGAVLEAELLLEPGSPEAIQSRMADFDRRRREKQPLEYPSAGSTFKCPAGGFAAQMIDEAGLKGFTVGGAQVSEKHAGFVINRGGAACDDIVKLMAQVRERVFKGTGVTLEPEVRFLGKEGEPWNF